MREGTADVIKLVDRTEHKEDAEPSLHLLSVMHDYSFNKMKTQPDAIGSAVEKELIKSGILPPLAVDFDSPSKLPDVRDAKAVQNFLDQLPKELRDPEESLSAVRQALWKSGDFNSKDYLEKAGVCKNIAEISDWLKKAAAQPGATDKIKEEAAEYCFDGAMAKLDASVLHAALAQPGHQADAGWLTDTERTQQSKLARDTFEDLAKNDQSVVSLPLFRRAFEQYAQDKEVDPKSLIKTVKELTDKALGVNFNEALQDSRSSLMLSLSGMGNLAPEQTKVVQEQMTKLSTDLEKCINAETDSRSKFIDQINMMHLYHDVKDSGGLGKAYEEAQKTWKESTQYTEEQKKTELIELAARFKMLSENPN
jgi:hypothetical protein